MSVLESLTGFSVPLLPNTEYQRFLSALRFLQTPEEGCRAEPTERKAKWSAQSSCSSESIQFPDR